VAGFTPLTLAQFRAIAVDEYQAALVEAGYSLNGIPDTGTGTIPGAIFDGFALMAVQQQYQDVNVQLTSRLLTIPANPDGSPNPEVDSFVAPFGIKSRLGGQNATYAGFWLNLISRNLQGATTIPTGLLFTGNGQVYVLVADTNQPAYDPTLYNGAGGYTVPQNALSVLASATCLAGGSIGNAPRNTSWTIYSASGSPAAPGLGYITNPGPITTGVDAESDAALKARFVLSMQNGQYAVVTAIKAAVLGTQVGLVYSYGDFKRPDGSYQGAFFTLVVNVAGSSTLPLPALVTAVKAAVLNVRAGGIEYTVVAPTLIMPQMTGNIAVRAGFDKPTVLGAVQTAFQLYGNAIGLDPDGGVTTLSYAQALSTMISVAGVNPVGTTLCVNGVAGVDVVAPFAYQIVVPVAPVFTMS